MGSDPKRCEGRRRDGRPCGAFVPAGRALCFGHDPEAAERRAAARRKGGANSAKIVRLRALVPPRLLPVYNLLEGALSGVLDGTLDPRRAAAAASVGRALVAVLQAGEIEDRLRRLERRREEEGDALAG